MTREPRLIKQAMVPLADIETKHRLRPVSEAGVESLIASISDLKVMKDAIHVRKVRDGKLILIAGAHRLEAAKRLGWSEIEAKVWTDVTDDWARLLEVDDNLAGAEMDPLDTAVFLATRKRIYERLHPETRAGVAGAMARHHAADMMSVASFATATAQKFGLSDRHVRRMVAAGEALGPDEVLKLRSSERVTIADLQTLSQVTSAPERYAVINAMASRTAKSAADARRRYAAEQDGSNTVVKVPVEEELQCLMRAWKRASAAARRRFIQAEFEEVERLVSVVSKARRGFGQEAAE